MALKFKCQNCGKDIIVVYRKSGQIVKCTACGIENVIPEDAIETGDEPKRSNIAVTGKTTEETAPPDILGPRKLEDMLSEAWRIYKKNYLRLWAIAAVNGILYTVFFGLMYASIFLIPFIKNNGDSLFFLPFFLIGGILAVVIFVFVDVWVRCALIYLVSAQYFNKDVNFSQAYGYAWSRLGRAIGASILVALAVGGLSVTIIGIPFAVYLGVCWCFALQTVLLEGCGPLEALSRSYALAKGNWWRVFGINIMFAIIMAGINSIAGIIPILGLLISIIVSTPIVVIGSVLLYFDLRVRKQGYTFEKLIEDLKIKRER